MSRQIMAALALALIGAGCATKRGAQPDERFVVGVVNENYYAARIHAVWDGGNRRSLGTIDGNGGLARMALAWEPRALVFEIQFQTEGSAWVTQQVDVSPGDSIELRVPPNIRESGFFRRMRR